MSSKSTIFVILACFVVGLGWGLIPEEGLCLPWSDNSNPVQKRAVTKARINNELGTFASLAQELKPSVVNISVVKQLPPRSRSGRLPRNWSPESSDQGSGVIISSNGEVLTNNHVVKGAQTISVKLSDGREMKAEVVGTDSNTDLALLRLKNAQDLPVARLGNSDELAVGDWVMAIGNPFGLEATVTVGVLSGKGRVITARPYDDYLQTDASINPGNSGGPLFNTSGEVVGINTAIVQGGQGIGFSIPINLAKEVSSDLSSKGRVVRGFIGLGIQSLTPALKSALGISPSVNGALVASVMPTGPADKAGLTISDVIVAVDNNRIQSDRDLIHQVAKLPIGTEVPFTVLRDNTEETVFIQIIERPSPESEPAQSKADLAPNVRVGVAVTDLIGGREPRVVVTEVLAGSAAARAGLKRGDLIRAVGANSVDTAHDFFQAVARVGGDLALLIERQGRTSFVVVKE